MFELKHVKIVGAHRGINCTNSLIQTYNTNEQLKSFYKVLSTNTDGETEFASTVEGSFRASPLTCSPHAKTSEENGLNELPFHFPPHSV